MRTTHVVPLVLMLPFIISPAWSADWPGFLGPQRDGHSPDTGLVRSWPENGPSLLWKVETIGPGWSSVAVVGDFIYTTGDADGKHYRGLRCPL